MQATRERIVEYLRRQGQATVDELADEVGLTSMAVRHHLNVLQADSLVEVSRTRRDRRPGRPVQVYGLTDEARKTHPQEYYHLTDVLLAELIDRMDPNEVEQLFTSIADRLVQESPQAREAQSFEDRLDEVVAFLRTKGFVAEWQQNDTGYVIRHLACPYRELAKRYHQVCLLDERIISSMLETQPQRVSCMASNDGECTYCLEKPGTSAGRPIDLTFP